ncbi:MAG: orotidine-5'-phosphate decarboxylase [Kiritimatiellia bacterium]
MATGLIVALDVPNANQIPDVVKKLPAEVSFYKVGLELYTAAGPAALTYLKDAGKQVFLDLKLHDIPRTVARSVESATTLGVDLLTVHACGGRAMLEAATEAAKDRLNIVAVTVLTSLDQSDLASIGVQRALREHILALGKLAIDSGVPGLVCSPLETRSFRETLGQEPILITPGIRPAGAEAGDQKRIATPAMAAADGSSYIVVGRPILEASNPGLAAEQILAELAP